MLQYRLSSAKIFASTASNPMAKARALALLALFSSSDLPSPPQLASATAASTTAPAAPIPLTGVEVLAVDRSKGSASR